MLNRAFGSVAIKTAKVAGKPVTFLLSDIEEKAEDELALLKHPRAS
jgi:hypothetical protein